jgi:pimeloyl-ACP methyl ester carboxylesterase
MTRRSIVPFATLLLLTSQPGGLHAAAIRMTAIAPQITAGTDYHWTAPLLIHNPFETALYLDSLLLTIEDLDPGETRLPRVTRTSLPFIVKMVRAVSTHDSSFFQYEAEPTAEHARLTFEVQTHNADGVYRASTTVEALPGDASNAHPSQFITVGGRRIETVFVPAPTDSGSAPGVLIVHDRGANARHLIHLGEMMASHGYSVLLVSMPGYGQSEGAPDLSGPASLEAAAAAFDRLSKTKGVDAKRVGAWGIGDGASVVLQLARVRPSLRAVLGQSGLYDLWAGYRVADAATQKATVTAAGSDSAAWKSRSPALSTGKVTAAVLLLHGERDATAPIAQARDFRERLQGSGTLAQFHAVVSANHVLSHTESWRAAFEFFGHELQP